MLIAVTFLGSLAWSFVFVALPFQVERLSTSGPAGTLAWTGWILGVASLGAVVTVRSGRATGSERTRRRSA